MKKRFIAVCLAAAAAYCFPQHTHSNAAAGDVTESIAVPCAGKQRQSGRSGVKICRPRPCGNHGWQEKLQNVDSLEESTDVVTGKPAGN